MKAAQEPARATRPVERPVDGPHGRARDRLREDETPPAETEGGSVGRAAAGLAREIGRSVRSLWHRFPNVMRGAIVWVGAPVAAGVFGIGVAYDLLGAYADFQADAVQHAKVRAKKLALERNALRQELEEALAAVAEAREEAVSANKELARFKVEAEQLRRQGAMTETKGARAGTGAVTVSRGQLVVAASPVVEPAATQSTAKPAAAMPCNLDGASQELGAKLKDCMDEYKRHNGG